MLQMRNGRNDGTRPTPLQCEILPANLERGKKNMGPRTSQLAQTIDGTDPRHRLHHPTHRRKTSRRQTRRHTIRKTRKDKTATNLDLGSKPLDLGPKMRKGNKRKKPTLTKKYQRDGKGRSTTNSPQTG